MCLIKSIHSTQCRLDNLVVKQSTMNPAHASENKRNKREKVNSISVPIIALPFMFVCVLPLHCSSFHLCIHCHDYDDGLVA